MRIAADRLTGDKIDMHYRGTLEDTGAEFDASVCPTFPPFLSTDQLTDSP